jgi:hypothetical protein
MLDVLGAPGAEVVEDDDLIAAGKQSIGKV